DAEQQRDREREREDHPGQAVVGRAGEVGEVAGGPPERRLQMVARGEASRDRRQALAERGRPPVVRAVAGDDDDLGRVATARDVDGEARRVAVRRRRSRDRGEQEVARVEQARRFLLEFFDAFGRGQRLAELGDARLHDAETVDQSARRRDSSGEPAFELPGAARELAESRFELPGAVGELREPVAELGPAARELPDAAGEFHVALAQLREPGLQLSGAGAEFSERATEERSLRSTGGGEPGGSLGAWQRSAQPARETSDGALGTFDGLDGRPVARVFFAAAHPAQLLERA